MTTISFSVATGPGVDAAAGDGGDEGEEGEEGWAEVLIEAFAGECERGIFREEAPPAEVAVAGDGASVFFRLCPRR